MGSEAKRYLQDHSIPQLFEGLMTGLIFNKPENPIEFLESALSKVKLNPGEPVKWDMFIDPNSEQAKAAANGSTLKPKKSKSTPKLSTQAAAPPPAVAPPTEPAPEVQQEENSSTETPSEASRKDSNDRSSPNAHDRSHSRGANGRASVTSRSQQRVSSVMKAAEVARIPDVPIVLFMGGPGGGKTRHAARVRDALEERGLVHICMPDMIRAAIAKYKDRFPEWKEAADRYQRGELIPNNLALALVKAEMGRQPHAKAFFLEGFPREARQVEDFERQVKHVSMAMILDYDEATLRNHMEKRGLTVDIIDQRIKEFKQKTLPSAKYFDDQRLLHLIPGEKSDQEIFERMKSLVERAMESESPIINSASTTPHPDESARNSRMSTARSSSKGAVTRKMSPAPLKLPTPPSQTNRLVEDAVAAVHAPAQAATPPVQRTPTPPIKTPVGTPKTATPKETTPVPTPPKTAATPQPTPPAKTPTPPKHTPTPPKTATPPVKSPSPQAKAPSPPAIETASETPYPITEATPFPKGLPSNAPVILIVGAPGSNKTEFARKIAQKYEGFVYLSMGEILRRKVQQNPDDDLWHRIGKKMDQGDVVPMKICRELLYQAIHDMGNKSWGYVIEGYPRSQNQLQDFENQIERVDVALLIDCTEHFCIENIKKRRQDSKENVDSRLDDSDDVVKARMALFKSNTLPMLKALDDKNKLRVVRYGVEIDGDREEGDIFKEVVSAIDNSVFIEDNGSGKSLTSSKGGSLEETPAQ
ncbi:hypothetical protein QR680_015347 [Steinernema hermaphroditum]|uniref:Adenylate kinase isoenzyme 5 n=1 Tax=Steinernema hermaphroditum TaxID=289476 RepID=A0AA39H7D5_9BILA|nr:hypothetical protein QR680_015347 [Steinernema hermaphroditum]